MNCSHQLQMYTLFPNKPIEEQVFSHKKFVFLHLLASHKEKCDEKGRDLAVRITKKVGQESQPT